ncbi:sigma-70 family RNA polymerase sigma factor [Saccharothrix yanglingensis]|uniref:RNA polymerase n=1 Tax=Saccharothrix yanglingensis TaxID=659496 RepID=A0ABU0XA77_9PSEU|nr:sigma-70 family RNA polymerase sigma factor [Saccharothrix yanglingensis]MDQ2589051.1 RNA polymerase [Saccharothrix yanglingensis]
MSAFEELVEAHGSALLGYASRLTRGDHHRAEDVVQETWLRAWRNLDRMTEDRGSVRAWLMRVAHNIVVDQYRSRRARPTEVEMPEGDPTSVPGPADEVLNRVVVGSVLEALPPTHRSTVVEVYFADRTAAGAAEVLSVPVGTVKSRVHKALRVLRAELPAPAALEAA